MMRLVCILGLPWSSGISLARLLVRVVGIIDEPAADTTKSMEVTLA